MSDSNGHQNGNGRNGHKPKRSYSEADKATAIAMLESNGFNILKTSRETGIPPATITKWRDGKSINADVSQKYEEKAASLGELFEEVARLYLARAKNVDAVDETKGKDAVMAAAIATDKTQLLKGEATSITKDVTKSNEDRAERTFKLLKPQAA